MNGVAAGVRALACSTAPTVKPPASAAPLLRSSLRPGRFKPIGLSFAREPARNRSPRVYARLGGLGKLTTTGPSSGSIAPALEQTGGPHAPDCTHDGCVHPGCG